MPIALTRSRERALLTLLLLAEGRAVPADVLIENLWAGEPPPNAASALRSYLSRLRARLSLGEEDLANTPSGYRLRDPGPALDVYRFTELLTQGQQARAARRHREEVTLRAAPRCGCGGARH